MAEKGFGSELWKNVQAVTFGPDGELEAPVRANGRQGIVVGVDQVAESDAEASQESRASHAGRTMGWWARLIRG